MQKHVIFLGTGLHFYCRERKCVRFYTSICSVCMLWIVALNSWMNKWMILINRKVPKSAITPINGTGKRSRGFLPERWKTRTEVEESEVWPFEGTYASFIPPASFVSLRRRMNSLGSWGGGEVWSRDDDHSHLAVTGHMQFGTSCATYVGWGIAPHLTCTCAPALFCATFQPLREVRLKAFLFSY